MAKRPLSSTAVKGIFMAEVIQKAVVNFLMMDLSQETRNRILEQYWIMMKEIEEGEIL